jgi:FeS assembly SUF system protein
VSSDATVPTTTAPAPAAPDRERLREEVIEVLRTVYDPEIPVNIYELGLVYEVEVDEDAHAKVRMTLTSPMCPVAESLPPEVEQKIRQLPGIAHVDVELTWEPPWNPSMMSEAAKLQLGF